MRRSEIKRKTRETDISLTLDLDGSGVSEIQTGCGFLDHMLTLFAAHSCFDLNIFCSGDTNVDYHHTTEDIGICLGRAFAEALGEKRGIRRYADIILPMDEALVLSAVDISGRGQCFFSLGIPAARVGDFDTELVSEFFTAFAREGGVTLHLRGLSGTNSHHIIEGAFKASARSLSAAASVDPARSEAVPSTKGVL